MFRTKKVVAGALGLALALSAAPAQANPVTDLFNQLLSGPAVTSQANPTPARVVAQGMSVRTPQGVRCSLTFTDAFTAYTARHCFLDRPEVGTQLSDDQGNPVGTVAAVPGQRSIDAVRVALKEAVTVPGGFNPVREAASLQPGEALTTIGRRSGENRGTVMGSELYGWSNGIHPEPDRVMLLNEAITQNGDSGGAVLDSAQRVVGLITGVFDLNGRLHTAFTPIEQLNSL